MNQFFVIHPDNPQKRLIDHACEIIGKGGVVVYPTDSAYAIGCHIGDKEALDRIRQIRRLDDKHLFSLVCRDLSDLSKYARVSNAVYRQLKAHIPGPYTFILEASKEVPRRLSIGKRKQIGLRVPDNKVLATLLETLGEPLLNTTLILPNDDYPLVDPYEIKDMLAGQVDLVIDGGYCGSEETSVIDLSGDSAVVVREGLGPVTDFA